MPEDNDAETDRLRANAKGSSSEDLAAALRQNALLVRVAREELIERGFSVDMRAAVPRITKIETKTTEL